MKWFRQQREEAGGAVPMISARELKTRLERGEDVLVLDVRQPEAYAEFPCQIPGSVRIAPADLPERYGELPRNRLIAAYCT